MRLRKLEEVIYFLFNKIILKVNEAHALLGPTVGMPMDVHTYN